MEKSLWYQNNHKSFLDKDVAEYWFYIVFIATLGILALALILL